MDVEFLKKKKEEQAVSSAVFCTPGKGFLAVASEMPLCIAWYVCGAAY
jgi:hypothetical protein